MGVRFRERVYALRITKLTIECTGALKVTGLGVEMNSGEHAEIVLGNLIRVFRRQGHHGKEQTTGLN